MHRFSDLRCLFLLRRCRLACRRDLVLQILCILLIRGGGISGKGCSRSRGTVCIVCRRLRFLDCVLCIWWSEFFSSFGELLGLFWYGRFRTLVFTLGCMRDSWWREDLEGMCFDNIQNICDGNIQVRRDSFETWRSFFQDSLGKTLSCSFF